MAAKNSLGPAVKVAVNVDLPPALHAQVARIAAHDRRPFVAVVREALAQYAARRLGPEPEARP